MTRRFEKDQGEEAAETTLHAEWTLTTHTCVKTKTPNEFNVETDEKDRAED